MPTRCNAEKLEFSCVERRRVMATLDGGTVSSDAKALLRGRTEVAIGLIDRLAGSFIDGRAAGAIELPVRTLIGQRVFGMALGYEDLNDNEQLRHDPVLGALLGTLTARRSDRVALTGKSALNRLELHPARVASRYHKIRLDPAAIKALWIEQIFDAHRKAPCEIFLDLDATDNPLHGSRMVRSSMAITTATVEGMMR